MQYYNEIGLDIAQVADLLSDAQEQREFIAIGHSLDVAEQKLSEEIRDSTRMQMACVCYKPKYLATALFHCGWL